MPPPPFSHPLLQTETPPPLPFSIMIRISSPPSDGDASADAFRQNLEAAARRAIERMAGRSEEVDQIGNEGASPVCSVCIPAICA